MLQVEAQVNIWLLEQKKVMPLSVPGYWKVSIKQVVCTLYSTCSLSATISVSRLPATSPESVIARWFHGVTTSGAAYVCSERQIH
jgi:hypothetical protein